MEFNTFDKAVALHNDISNLENSIANTKFMMDKNIKEIRIVDNSGYNCAISLEHFSEIADDILDYLTRRLEKARDAYKVEFRKL